MKKELKNIIYETVSTLRKLFSKLKIIEDSKSRKISELETLVATTKAELEGALSRTEMRQGMPPSKPRPDQTIRVEWRVAPSGVGKSKIYRLGKNSLGYTPKLWVGNQDRRTTNSLLAQWIVSHQMKSKAY